MSVLVRPKRPRRLLAAAALTGAALLSSAVLPAAAHAQEGGHADLKQISATVRPSVSYMTVQWRGYIHLTGSSEDTWTDKITATLSCSGVVVDSTGYVATAGHCVDPAGGKTAIIDTYLARAVEKGWITTTQARRFQSRAYALWKVEGERSGSEPARTVKVFVGGRSSGVEASVVDFKPHEDGDVALLKLDVNTPLLAAQLATTEPDTGLDITSIGYPGSVSRSVDWKRAPSFKTGRISSHQTTHGVPFNEVDAAMSAGMSGGPTVDADGNVVGINSWGPGGETQSFNFITGTSVLKSMMARNGVSPTASGTDTAWRNGLDAFFAGDYRKAKDLFQQVSNEAAASATVRVYLSKATAEAAKQPVVKPEPKDDSSLPIVPIAVAVLLLGVGAGLVLVLVLVKAKNRTPKAPAAPSMPIAPPMPVAATQPIPVTPVAPVMNGHAPTVQDGTCPACNAVADPMSNFCGVCGTRLLTTVH